MKLDPNGESWRIVAAEARAIIDDARRQLEQSGLGPTDTEHARGQIATARRILRLAEPDRAPKIAPEAGYDT